MAASKKKPAWLVKKEKEWAQERRASKVAAKKKAFAEVLAKEKVETYMDIYNIFCGLSRKAINSAAYKEIHALARSGFGPSAIVELMEGKKGSKEAPK